MKTSQLQSMLCRNAAVITILTASMINDKAMSKDTLYAASKRQFFASIRRTRTHIIKLAAIQKAIKFDLQAQKLARLQVVGHRRSKHNQNDPRYTAWLNRAQLAA